MANTPLPGYVTHIIPSMDSRAGGPPVAVDQICQALHARGWKVRVVTTCPKPPGKDSSFEGALKGGYDKRIAVLPFEHAYAFSLSVLAELKKALTDSCIVHVHSAWSFPTVAAMALCRSRRVPFFFMPHGMYDLYSMAEKPLKKSLYGGWIEHPLVRLAEGVIYTHESEKLSSEKAVKNLPKGFVVPLAAERPDTFAKQEAAERMRLRFPELRGKRVVVYFSRLTPRKGVELLIDALAVMKGLLPDTHLLIAGDGPADYLGGLLEKVKSQGLERSVTFSGHLEGPDRWQALAVGEVFALPSAYENFGLAVIEALACGLPVVISREVKIWKDLVSDGAALICERNRESVASRIAEILGDPVLLGQMAAAAESCARTRFSWQKSAERLEELYLSAVGSRTR